jgi:hypothetical protein
VLKKREAIIKLFVPVYEKFVIVCFVNRGKEKGINLNNKNLSNFFQAQHMQMKFLSLLIF